MSVANGLSVVNVKENLELTQLENNLIAKKILFQKVFKLPKSRMAAVKDKIVNIPIGDEDVLNTVQALPRTPSEAGLVEVKLKRKLEYKNYHQYEYIDPEKIFQALKYLKDSGNPHYQFFDDRNEFEKRCKSDDPEGFEAMFGENEDLINNIENEIKVFKDGDYEEILDLKDYLINQDAADSERNDKANDPTRKFQIDYDTSVCLTQQFPEAFHEENPIAQDSTEKNNYQNKENIIAFAPGEGKIPENILTSENWDALAFPLKHPDGKFNLHHKRGWWGGGLERILMTFYLS